MPPNCPCMYWLVGIGLFLFQTNLGTEPTTVQSSSHPFCAEYPNISRLIRLYSGLYLELHLSPGNYYLYDIKSGSFVASQIQLDHFMGDGNHHIFSSVTSIASLDVDYFDHFEKYSSKRGVTESRSHVTVIPRKRQTRFIKARVPNSLKNSRIKRNNVDVIKRDYVVQPNEDYEYYQGDIIIDREERNRNDLVDWKSTRHTSSSSTKSPIGSIRENGNISVRIWGYLDMGVFPVESELPWFDSEPLPQLGYEDFYLNLMNGSLQHKRSMAKPASKQWRLRRTRFPFDCFIHEPQLGSVAITHIKYKQRILRYQLEKLPSRSKQVPFDVHLKIFYSEQKFDSCVDLGTVVALLHDHNQVTLIDRNDLLLSFRANNSQITNFVQTDLNKLLCEPKPLSDVLGELKQKLKRNQFHSLQIKSSKRLSARAFNSKLSSPIGQSKVKPKVQNRKVAGLSLYTASSEEAKALNRTLFVVVIVISAAFAIAIVVAFAFHFVKPSAIVLNEAKTKISGTVNKVSKLTLDLLPNDAVVPKEC